MSQDHVLSNTARTLEVTFYADGTAITAGTVTVDITREDGTALVTDGATTTPATGVYRYTLAAQSDLDVLKAEWSGTVSGNATTITTHHEVVGGHLFTEAQARAFDNAAMADTTNYPDADIAAERARITDDLQTWTGVSWIPRYRRSVLAGNGLREVWLPNCQVHRLQSVTVNGTSQTVGDIEIDKDLGRLLHTGNVFTAATVTEPRNVTVKYEHGYEYLRNGVDRIALLLLRYRLVASNIPDSATSMTNEYGTTRLLPMPRDVVEWVRANDHRIPVG